MIIFSCQRIILATATKPESPTDHHELKTIILICLSVKLRKYLLGDVFAAGKSRGSNIHLVWIGFIIHELIGEVGLIVLLEWSMQHRWSYAVQPTVIRKQLQQCFDDRYVFLIMMTVSCNFSCFLFLFLVEFLVLFYDSINFLQFL